MLNNDTTVPPPAAPAPQTALPLFFGSVVGVTPVQHSHLRLDRSTGYAFAIHAQSVPVGLGEFEVASQHYPIVFTAGPQPTPVALLGIKEGENPFVDATGTWRAGSYIPAYVRSFPFIFVEDSNTQTLYVGMEPNAASLRTDTGTPLFEDGSPSPALNEAISFCSAFRDNLNVGLAFGKALDDAGLLEEEEATINFNAGGVARVRGFKVLKADRLEKISDAMFLDWRRRGWIAAIYAHLYSTGRWSRLVELAAPADPEPKN